MDPFEVAIINSLNPPRPFEPHNETGKKVILSGISQVFLDKLGISDPFESERVHQQLRNLSGYHIQHNGQYRASVVKALAPTFSRALPGDKRLPALSNNSHYLERRPEQVSYRNGLHRVWVGPYEIVYTIGDMHIDVLHIGRNEAEQKRLAKEEKPTMYLIAKDDKGLWRIKHADVNKINTKYAAINGQSNDLEKATWLMGRYLEHHYGASEVREYTLFHNPSEGGGWDTWESNRDKIGGLLSTPISRQFSGVLEANQHNDNAISWLAHSQGTIIFTQAVNLYNRGRSRSRIVGAINKIRDVSYEGTLNNHSAIFQGTAAHVATARQTLAKAGITLQLDHSHRYDLVNQVIGLNFLTSGDAVGAIGSLVYSRHVFSGTVGQSPHTYYTDDAKWHAHMMNDKHGRGYTAIQQIFNKIEPTATSIQNATIEVAQILSRMV
ncbi:hypothetical protein [Marinibactrum halimedae]|uniref:Uncharacterized protein n=1 Tax=Marinibactrum halimedae TaxID=1444977 RepID=A0AA37T892_9GAMM|nr:hypothetical protein [Marinibactrum halimedae]MCD9458111.1 hypothetical protein [Marinibactrum halimedae]GLS25045.1 hypothetical protein GCM10007877_07590 [Marinibactrum halimedae]